MNYQLVLQWNASSLDDYDEVVEIEEMLSRSLTAGSEVDGHDMGSGQANIFIHTADPHRTFDELKALLGDAPIWRDARVAFRERAGNVYSTLWPTTGGRFSVT
jgi:hypothetical protein